MLCFTAEEAWLSRYRRRRVSVHLELFPEVPAAWRDDALAEKWRKVRLVRRVVTGALEIERAQQAHRLVAGSATDRPRLRPGPVRGAGRRRSRRSLHHLGRDAGRRTRGRPTRSGCRTCAGVAVVPNLAEGTQMRALLENLARGRQRPGLSRRHAARRAGAARMGNPAQGGGVRLHAAPNPRTSVGPLHRPRACRRRLIACVLDQASKLWLLFVFDLAQPGRGRGHAVPRPRADLEHRHQLRPVPAGRRRSANGRCWRSRWSRWRCCGSGWPGPESRLIGAVARPDHRRRARQCHRPVAYGAVADFVLFHIDNRHLDASTGMSLTWPM